MSKDLSAIFGEDQKRVFKGIINPKKKVFLTAFARSGRIMQSCETAGIHWTTHYHWKKHDKKYLTAFQIAEQIAADFMEDEIQRRAFDGFDRPVTYEGKITATYKEYSDNLAMFRLKKVRPEYRDSFNVSAFAGPVQINVNMGSKVVDPLQLSSSQALMTLEQSRAVDEARRIQERQGEDVVTPLSVPSIEEN